MLLKPQLLLLLTFGFATTAPLLLSAEEAIEPSASVDFVKDIQPIFKRHCIECHGPDQQESNFRVDVRKTALAGGDFGEAAIVPGNSAESALFRYVSGKDDIVMPPDGEALSKEELAILKLWIEQGATWPDDLAGDEEKGPIKHWSLLPVQKPEPPQTSNNWPRGDIDRFIYDRLQKAKLSPAADADRTTLIRRVYFDMLGLPPSPERVQEFVDDRRPDAYDRLVEEVLASPRYGERWAQHWLDVVRFAETDGFEVNTPREHAWPYRDYVIRAFNSDKPYNDFVYEQLAGDLVGEDAATGFLVAAPALLPGQIGKDEDSILSARQDALDEVVSATGATFLGLTVGCARCHNHKFDPILQKDYFSLQAVFSGVYYGARPLRSNGPSEATQMLAKIDSQISDLHDELAKLDARPPVNAQRNQERFPPTAAKFVRFVIEETNNLEPCLDELEVFATSPQGQAQQNVALATADVKVTTSGSYPVENSHMLAYVNDGKYGNEKSWISNEVGGGWVQLEFPQAIEIDRVVWGRDRNGIFNDRLATRYRIEVANEPGVWTTVASSQTRLRYGIEASGGKLAEHVTNAQARDLLVKLEGIEQQRKHWQASRSQLVYAGTFSTPTPTFRLRRGDHRQRLEPVVPDILEVLGSLHLGDDASDSKRRDALARAIASKENPLTARVMANRIWHYHFGRGIVDTPSDFGKIGSAPTHPELLDYLAIEFMKNNWSMKQLHRLILRSRTYQQSSRVDNLAAQKIDGDARLLWRFPSRRLEAEAVRDSVLQTTGLLRHEMGGPGYSLFKPRVGLDQYEPLEVFGPEQWRRLIYAHKVRMAPDGVFTSFDMPDCGQLCSKRSNSTTPLQALNLFNSPFMTEQAQRFAERVRKEAGQSREAQLRRIFLLALQRDASPKEFELANAFVDAQGLEAFCRVMLNTNEFVMLP